MTKLMRANFARMVKNKVFLISSAFMFLIGLALPLIHFFDNKNNGAAWTPDSTMFTYVFFAPILISVLAALFIGSEYSDGTMRSKLIAGHGRCSIYLAQLTVCAAAGIILCIAYTVPHVCLGLALLGDFETSAGAILTYAGLDLALVAAFSAIFTLISMLWQNKAYSTACCILLTFIFLFAGIRIVSALNEPEYYEAYSYTENGVTTSEEAERNPNYLSGTARKIYEFLQDFLPGGQALQIANMNAGSALLLVLYDGIILFVVTVAGVVIFQNKDLK